MILFGLIIGLLLTAGLVVLLTRFAKQQINKGKSISWPFWTYLWGVVITVPCAFAGFIPQIVTATAQTEFQIEVWETIGLALGLPFFIHHLVGGTLLPMLWIFLLIRSIFKSEEARRS